MMTKPADTPRFSLILVALTGMDTYGKARKVVSHKNLTQTPRALCATFTNQDQSYFFVKNHRVEK